MRWLWALVVLLPDAALAQRFRAFGVDDVHATYELLTGYQRQSYHFPGNEGADTAEWSVLLGERLGVAGQGSVVHPRFWQWNLGLDVLVLQTWEPEAADDAAFDNSVAIEYDFGSTLLQQHPYPLTVYARRHTDVVRRDFVRNFELTTSSFGGDWSWQNKTAPVRVSASRQSNEYGAGSDGLGDDAYTQASLEARFDGARSNATLEYRLGHYSNETLGFLDTTDNDVSLIDIWYPGQDPDKAVRIDSRLRYSVRNADSDRDDGELGEWLTIRWLPELHSRFSYQLTTVHQGDVRSWQHGLMLDMRYRLWDSLLFGVISQGTAEQLPSETVWQGVVGGDVSYRKRVSNWFVMSHTWQALGTQELAGGGARWTPVVDEVVTLGETAAVVLRYPNVDVTSIVVVDPATSRRYLEGVDYAVQLEVGRALLTRLPGGSIPKDGDLEVSYQYMSAVGDYRTFDQRYLGRLQSTFSRYVTLSADVSERWAVRWEKDRQGQKDRYESFGGSIMGNAGIVSLSLDLHWNRALEFTSLDSTASVAARPTFDYISPAFGGRALFQRIDHTENRWLFEVFAEGSAAITQSLGAQLSWRYHREQGGPSDGDFIDGETSAQWRFRALFLRLEYRLQAQLREAQSYWNHRVFLSFGRTM